MDLKKRKNVEVITYRPYRPEDHGDIPSISFVVLRIIIKAIILQSAMNNFNIMLYV